MVDLVQVIVGALVTIVSQYVGFLALRRELQKKASKEVTEDHEKRLRNLENAHGGLLS